MGNSVHSGLQFFSFFQSDVARSRIQVAKAILIQDFSPASDAK